MIAGMPRGATVRTLGMDLVVLLLVAGCQATPPDDPWPILRSVLPPTDGKGFSMRIGNVQGLGEVLFLYLEASSPELQELELKAPLLAFSRGVCTGCTFVPARSTGDVADLYRRITGKEHPELKGELSEGYKAFVEGKGR